MQTLFWHDYETFGTDARRDRPIQFAGIRTTLELEVVDEPVMFYGKPPREMPPSPESCLITGITPQQAERDGVIEADFAARVHEQLATPGTCGVGYNSLRFDDEFTRQLLYRNFFEPYAREWENGNSRWDLIDLVRMCEALRPEGIVWPTRDDGAPSFKLEHLATRQSAAAGTRARCLVGRACADRSGAPDSRAPAALVGLALRSAPQAESLRAARSDDMTPVVHVSSRYPASRHCLAVIIPLAPHPSRSGEVIVYDLARIRPTGWRWMQTTSPTASSRRAPICPRASSAFR
jgi:exodeoxyribonuclease-1